MSAGIGIVLQARMGSARLPGKVLAPLDGRTILAHCIERLGRRSGLPVIVATTTEADDDVIVAEAHRLAAPVVRGPAQDVLARFVQTADAFDLTILIRATADNPAVDLDAPRRTLDILQRSGAGYVVERGLPVGAAVEAVACSALRHAHAVARDPYDREHVTPFLKRDRQFVALDALAPAAVRRPDLRLTVDTPEDLEWLRRVYAALAPGPRPAPLDRVIAAADRLAEVRRPGVGAGAR